MKKSIKFLILLSFVSLFVLTTGASLSYAYPSSTSECGSCHNTATLIVTSNATGAVNATVGKPFTLNIDAVGYTGGDQAFYVSIQPSWADNDQFSFTATSIQDNGADDLNSNLNEISISVDFTPISAGTYTIRIWAAGKSDVAGSLDVPVSTMYDANAPLIDSPADIEYEYMTTRNEITWIPSDPNPANYSIFRNGTLVGSGGWNGSSISILIDWLIPGIYEYTLIVKNIGGYFASDTVMVIVTTQSTTTTETGTISTTTPSETTSTPTTLGNPSIDSVVATPVTLVVGTWVGIIIIVVLISEILIRKGKW